MRVKNQETIDKRNASFQNQLKQRVGEALDTIKDQGLMRCLTQFGDSKAENDNMVDPQSAKLYI